MNRRSRDIQLVQPDSPEMFGNQALYDKQVDRYAVSARTGGVDDAQVCSDRRQGCRTEGELPVEVARFRMPADAGGSCTGASTPIQEVSFRGCCPTRFSFFLCRNVEQGDEHDTHKQRVPSFDIGSANGVMDMKS